MKDKKLQTVTPESVGVPSAAIKDYVDTLKERGVNLHSFLMMRHGKLCAEGYCHPYSEEKLQRMYSISKTFTSAAIGIMITEGKLKLDDKIADFFPEYLPENPHPYVLDTTIEDVLKMSVPFINTQHSNRSDNWLKSFFNAHPSRPSGTIFVYETSGTHALCALVERLSGKTIMEFLREKLAPLELSEDAWCIKGTDGYSWGGSGIMATLRDLAKFASLIMNGGKFDGQQLILEDYVKSATSKQIFNGGDSNGCRWEEGYGYQIWILADGVFAFRGMGSQHAICFPKQDFIFCCTCDNQGAELHDRLIYEELFNRVIPKLGEPMPENPAELSALNDTCDNMTLPLQKGEMDSPIRKEVDGVTYVIENRCMAELLEFRLDFDGDEGTFSYKTPRGDKEIKFGFGKNVEHEFPETHYYYEQIGKPSGKKYRSFSSAAWGDEKTLVIRTYTMDEYLGNLTITIGFKGDEVGVYLHKVAEFYMDEYPGWCGGRKKEK